MRKITEAIIHCTMSPWGTVLVVDQWHKKRRFSMCGYHFIISNGSGNEGENLKTLDGQIEVGRPLARVGAHCKGRNRHSIGICLVGNKSFSRAQFRSLNILLSELKVKFPGLKVYPHNYFNPNKSCPNFDVGNVLNYDFD